MRLLIIFSVNIITLQESKFKKGKRVKFKKIVRVKL